MSSKSRGRLTTPLVRDGGASDPPPGTRRSTPSRPGSPSAREADASSSFGIFSCSKATNEMNFLAQKFARQVMRTNNIDSCNRT